MTSHAPFDPSDPFDAMAEEFKQHVCDLARHAQDAAIYRDLGPQRQLECFLAGTLTGIVGVCFASITPEGRDTMMEYIAECLPVARRLAESIMDEG